MDFLERLKDSVNTIENLSLKCKLGYLSPENSLVLYSLPGGRVVQEFYDGEKDQELNYEFAMKSKDQEEIIGTLWLIENHLGNLQNLTSQDGSFVFRKIEITNTPYINSEDNQEFYIFQIDVKATITTYKET